MLEPNTPALVLAPMEGITDAPMRALQGLSGAFTYAVSEFLRVSASVIPSRVFLRDVPELCFGGRTPTGLPVQVQLLGGDRDRMAASAASAFEAGAKAIDINFGCPAPTVNRHDGGASLLKHPERIREIVAAIRGAVPAEIPVSAKLRLGWDSIESIHENAAMAAEGGASWLTIHARTRTQGYTPPVFWPAIGQVRANLGLPVIANGDIWTFEDFLRCREETGCRHFMIGRGALADPSLPHRIAAELGIGTSQPVKTDWAALFRGLVGFMECENEKPNGPALMRLKQWMKLAMRFGRFPYFEELKQSQTLAEFFERLGDLADAQENRAHCASCEA
jgi:tRNA-dihydrouridine synthase C